MGRLLVNHAGLRHRGRMSKVCRTENPFSVVEDQTILRGREIQRKDHEDTENYFRLVPPPTPSPKPMFNAHKIGAFFLKLVGLRSFIEA